MHVEQVRSLLRHSCRDESAPRMAEQGQLLPGEALAQLLGEIDPIGDQSFWRDTGRAALCEMPSVSGVTGRILWPASSHQ